jgi:hypothetical protein
VPGRGALTIHVAWRRAGRRTRRWAALLWPVLILGALLGPATATTAAAGQVTMDARVLLDGHVRVGSWMAVEVNLANDGPPVAGELRILGGAQGRTRFNLAVDLPTNSRKSVVLYAQPPAFGQSFDVNLVSSSGVVATRKVTFVAPDPSRTVVGVIAEKAPAIVSALRLPANANGAEPTIITLRVTDLPGRIEAWDALDRLVWQDVDSAALRPEQLASLRGWLAGGGRLTIVGGTAGPASLSVLPDDLLPYRPLSVLDVDAASFAGLIGPRQGKPVIVPALAGDAAAARGRILARSGDRVIAGEARYGGGVVTLVGVDPTGDWLARTPASDALWARLIPLRAVGPGAALGGPLVLGDDSQMLGALMNLPALALPPVGGLIGLLAGYVLLVGPVNYLVLRRIDRREWAWLTMPALVAAFTVAAFVYGNTLRGGQVILNQLAVVRGAAGTSDGLAQVYIGVFSPNRTTYQLDVPGGALLSSPSSSDMFGGFDSSANSGSLDILQGETTRVRDLAVGYNTLRAVRADVPVAAPKVSVSVRLDNGRMVGTVQNNSTVTLERAAVVLGGTVASLGDLAPGGSAAIDVEVTGNPFGQGITERVLGPGFFGGDPSFGGEESQLLQVRQAMLNQLTVDPTNGSQTGIGVDGPVLIAFGRGPVIDARIDGGPARATGNILYYVPLDLAVQGTVKFAGDLMRPTTIASDAAVFNKGDPFTMNFSQGTVTLAYRPAAFEGAITTNRLLLLMNAGGGPATAAGAPARPTGPGDVAPTKAEVDAQQDSIPIVELFDRATGQWMRFPHITAGSAMEIADPQRWVDPASGTVLVRVRSDRPDGVGFQLQVQLEGAVP